MIDIVRDYAAIGVGTVQATTTRAVGIGRTTVDRVSALRQWDPQALRAGPDALGSHSAVVRGRELVSGIVGGDLDGLIGRMGLVKKSELNAVRQQMHRLERRLGEVRGER